MCKIQYKYTIQSMRDLIIGSGEVLISVTFDDGTISTLLSVCVCRCCLEEEECSANKNQQIISNNLIILFWEVQLVWAKPAPIPNLIQSYNCKWYEIEYFKKQKYFVYKM